MEVGEDILDPLLVVRPPLDPVSTCHQRYRPCRENTNSGRPKKTSKTPLTGCLVGPPDSCMPMKLKGLWPHALSQGRTLNQLECRLPWQSPWSIGLCGFSWYPWCCGSSVWTYADAPSRDTTSCRCVFPLANTSARHYTQCEPVRVPSQEHTFQCPPF